jgi:hypothetical protein
LFAGQSEDWLQSAKEQPEAQLNPESSQVSSRVQHVGAPPEHVDPPHWTCVPAGV